MKSFVYLCTTLLLLLTASLACAEKRLTFATGGTAGVYFPLGEAIAQGISANSNGFFTITVQVTGASGENLRLIENGDVDMAIVQNDMANAAFHGTPPFREKLTNARAIARLYPEFLHVVANKNSGIRTLNDFKGKRISVGARGSGNELNCRQIFSHFGLTYKNITPIFRPYGETAVQFKNNQLDGFIFTIGIPNPAIIDITSDQEVTFVPLTGSVIDEVVEKFPYLVKDTIPANTYTGQKEPIHTLSVEAILVVNKDMTEENAYKLTKLLFEHLPTIAKAHEKAKEISLKHAKDGITIPFHPGALKYLNEVAKH
ncbi:MAG: TAXI family TRAP transporter solute-binding subunit [Desulfovibrio sp.]|nr:TAXI family TRAP transporter solute-binding subunit [Desulfovibrio sp.]